MESQVQSKKNEDYEKPKITKVTGDDFFVYERDGSTMKDHPTCKVCSHCHS